jgi:hypothetical protein
MEGVWRSSSIRGGATLFEEGATLFEERAILFEEGATLFEYSGSVVPSERMHPHIRRIDWGRLLVPLRYCEEEEGVNGRGVNRGKGV